MESKIKVAGHAAHPMLIAFPLGLLGTAAIFDGIQLASDEPRWAEAANYMIGAGLVSGLVAAVPGAVDYLAIPPGTRADRIGLLHGLGNAAVLSLFAASWGMRRSQSGDAKPRPAALALSFSGFALGCATAWLGGELVERLGVSVDEGANLNAPSSLQRESATAKLRDELAA